MAGVKALPAAGENALPVGGEAPPFEGRHAAQKAPG